jgi:hypothetical protein
LLYSLAKFVKVFLVDKCTSLFHLTKHKCQDKIFSLLHINLSLHCISFVLGMDRIDHYLNKGFIWDILHTRQWVYHNIIVNCS